MIDYPYKIRKKFDGKVDVLHFVKADEKGYAVLSMIDRQLAEEIVEALNSAPDLKVEVERLKGEVDDHVMGLKLFRKRYKARIDELELRLGGYDRKISEVGMGWSKRCLFLEQEVARTDKERASLTAQLARLREVFEDHIKWIEDELPRPQPVIDDLRLALTETGRDEDND